ncbi:MAG: hypothetical protein J6T56_07260 [Bacteroidales bacterium]|nr:hypothetical protein [Bacteroidales bacterium]
MKKRHTNKDFAAVAFCTLLFALAATSVQAQDLFIPAKDADWIDDDPFLQQTVFEGSNCYYFCATSYYHRKRHALSLHDSTLVYVHVLRDDWKSWLLTGFWKPKTLRYEMSLRQTEQRAILDLLEAAIQTAKTNNKEVDRPCDYATYYLCHNARKVTVWSSDGWTLPTRTVHALDSLCYATEHSDRAVLLRQIETCRTLTDEFRQLYQSTCNFLKPDKPYPVLNIHISSDNEILVNDTPCSLQQLKDFVKTFMDTSGTEIIKIKHLGEYPVSKGVINFSSSRNALYKLYCDVQIEITTAINELRDDLALKKFGKKFEHLDTDFQAAINEAVPLKFEEQHPK